MSNQTNSQQLTREKLAFAYSTALEDGDFDTVANILEKAEQDPVLEQMLLELNEAWEGGMEEAMIQEIEGTESWKDRLNGRSFNLSIFTNWRHYIRPAFTVVGFAAIAWFCVFSFQVFEIYSSIPSRSVTKDSLLQINDGFTTQSYGLLSLRAATIQEKLAYQARNFVDGTNENIVMESAPAIPTVAPRADSNSTTGSNESDSLNIDSNFTNGRYQAAERLIIRNGTMTLEVDDTRHTRSLIEDYVAEMSETGAFVVNSSEHSGSQENPRIIMNIRVPATQFDETMTWLEGTAVSGTHPSRSETATDVTEEFVDLSARLESMVAARDRLLEIMENARTTKDLLEVEEQLTQREAEIEGIQGRMQFLQESAALSLIEVNLNPYILNQPIETGWRLAETVRRAFDYLIQNGQNLADLLIFVTIGLLPFALLLILIIYVVYRFAWKRFDSQSVAESAETDLAD